MGTNRRIYEESVNLSRRENGFVCLTSSRPSRLLRYIFQDGIELIASGVKAHSFSYAAMTLTVDPPSSDNLTFYGSSDSADRKQCKYIFCLDELPTVCRRLLKYPGSMERGQYLQNTTIHIYIHNLWKEQSWEVNRSASGLSRLQKLLDPLRQLHSFGAAQIEGPLSASYKRYFETDICKECPTAMDVIGAATVMVAQADEQVRQDLPFDAINKYKIALNHVRSRCWTYGERTSIVDSGPFPGLTAEETVRNLKVRLLARIASTYFRSRMLRMARIYVERALNPHHSLEYEFHKLYELDRRPWQHVVYAEVLHVSAQIWYAYGHVGDAVYDLRQVQEFVELSEEQQCTLEAWQRHKDNLSERCTKRIQAREVHLQKEGSNTEGMRTWSALTKVKE